MKRTHWTKELLAECAKEYTSRSEFKTGNQGAYVFARKAGWLDEVCQHMPRKQRTDAGISKRGKKDIARIARKCKSRAELLERDRSAYEIARTNGWLDEICAHMTWLRNPNGTGTNNRKKEKAL